jgi:hypothetical protein
VLFDFIYGLYLGGSPLDNEFKQTVDARRTYWSASQHRYLKSISSIEQQLVTAHDSVILLKI